MSATAEEVDPEPTYAMVRARRRPVLVNSLQNASASDIVENVAIRCAGAESITYSESSP
jgi:hypothetical protein